MSPFRSNSSSRPIQALFSIFTIVALAAPCVGQAQVQVQAQQQAPAQACAPQAACAGGGAGGQQRDPDRLETAEVVQRGAVMGVTGAGAVYATGKVSGVVKGAVDVGTVRSFPLVGTAVVNVPVVGNWAASGKLVPTTLGQVPVMGHVVKAVPVVGPVVAGPANPILVGAVAVDNYVIPKYSPCGYTKSSVVAATNDFNSAPKLRHYVNYVAPLPYSHPPIYSPGTLKTDLPADVAYIDGVSHSAFNDEVAVPGL